MNFGAKIGLKYENVRLCSGQVFNVCLVNLLKPFRGHVGIHSGPGSGYDDVKCVKTVGDPEIENHENLH